jgi:thiol-disulfide isomerase/thioredoxin
LKTAPVALFAVVAVLGAAAGFYSYRHYVARAPGAQPETVPMAAPTPPIEAAASGADAEGTAEAPALKIPEEVPDVKLADLQGTARSLRAIPGKTRLFNFWASWCEPCRREIPLLNALQSTHKADGLQIVGIAVDMRPAVDKFLKFTPLHYLVLVGEEEGMEAAQKFGMELALPFTVFADAQNRIVAIKLGELHRDEAEAILAQVQKLNAGQVSLEASRASISTLLKTLAIERAKQSPPG